jgi:hypothetical protein
MSIAFTICSNNYYSQALTLAQSCKAISPDTHFIIVIVDEHSSSIKYSSEYEHIFIDQLPINTEEIISKYDIVELNTSIKPSVFLYIIKKYKSVTSIHYFDPDIKIYSPINELEKHFADKSILLTPHILTPINIADGHPQDHLFLNYGIYNLGYLGIKVNTTTISLLSWWEGKTLTLGYNKVCQGLFVDQLWINHVPVFYHDCTKILLHPGCNAAPWNLHERKITLKEGKYYVNDVPLIFFHFSNYKYSNSDSVAKHYRYTFDSESDLKILYQEYHQELLTNNIEKYSKVECSFYKQKEQNKRTKVINLTKKIVRQVTPPILLKICTQALLNSGGRAGKDKSK